MCGRPSACTSVPAVLALREDDTPNDYHEGERILYEKCGEAEALLATGSETVGSNTEKRVKA